jgi:hypothetical protein
MAASAYSYSVTAQIVNQTVNDDAGNTLVGSYITFRTGKGNTGVVFIPDNLRTVEHVKNTVRANARLIDDIGAIAETYN